MNHDQLFFIKPHFPDHGKSYYCPGCAELVGLLEFYPALKASLEVRWVDFARPRPELVALLGAENQNCPVLVLKSVALNLSAHLKVQHANGHDFVADAREIGEYLAHVHGIGLPH
jgi:hypothetical protein